MTQKTKIIIEKNQEQELAKFEPRFRGLVTETKELKVIDEKSNIKATELIREIENLVEQYKQFLEVWIGDFKRAVKKREDIVKPYIKSLQELAGKNSYTGLRGQKADYEAKKDEARRIEEERIRKEQLEKYKKEMKKAEKKGEIPPPPPAPVKVEAPKEESVSYRDDWTFDKEKYEIEKVPEVLEVAGIPEGIRLKILDAKAVQKLIDMGCREIPGIRIFCRKVLMIREEKIENL